MGFEALNIDEVHDLLIELPYLNETKYFFTLEGTKFIATQHDAKEFCLDYGRDAYSQAVSGIDTKEKLLAVIDHGYLGSVVKKI